MDIATLKEMLKDWGKPVKPLTWKKYLGWCSTGRK